MNRYDYFIASMKAKAHYDRDWMLRTLTVVITEPTDVQPYTLRHTESEVQVWVPDVSQAYSWQTLEGAIPFEIPFVYHEVLKHPVKAGDVENLKYDLEGVTWGDMLFNSRVLVFACGDLIDWMPGPVQLSKLNNIFAERMKDDPPKGQEVPGELYTYHWKAIGKAIGDLAGYECVIPSLTEKSLQPPADIKEHRERLLKENEGHLSDPVVQAKIQNELVDSYVKNQLKGDPAEGLIHSKKSINTAIKRMFLIHGPENGFETGGGGEFITTALIEKTDPSKRPVMINSLRAGSYYRGALTALAGEDVDLMGRIFQNVLIQEEFCGTEHGLDQIVEKRHLHRYILENGERVHLTTENIDSYIGKIVEMLSPNYCLKSQGDICAFCVGSKIAKYATSVGSMVAEVPSTMMGAMMGSAHAKELKVTPIDMSTFLE